MTDNQITAKLLNAAELFHYANKFRNQIFVIAFKDLPDFNTLVSDLKVLHKARINLIIVFQKVKDYQKIKEFCQFDLEFKALELDDIKNIGEIHNLHDEGLSPVINLKNDDLINFMNQIVINTKINKLIFAGSYYALEVNGQIKHFLSKNDLQQKVLPNESLELITKFQHLLDKQVDLVLIPANQGELFREIFTYLGAGTLVTAETDINFKPAEIGQVSQIYYILLSYVSEGLILPISEKEIAERLSDFFVLSIEGEVIAVVSIKIYQQAAEIGKLCTLPRYRNKGLASRLVQQVIEYCETKELDYLFALSRSDKVLDIFRTFGFVDCTREELPVSWQQGYDFSRPTRACRLEIK